MDRPHYDFNFEILNEHIDFEFYSIGHKGTLKKIIRFVNTDIPDFHSLSLFDVLPWSVEPRCPHLTLCVSHRTNSFSA